MMSGKPPKESISEIEAPWSAIRKSARNIYRDRRLFKAVNSVSRVKKLSFPDLKTFCGHYLISSDQGVFAIQDGQMLQLIQRDTYGIAVREGELFIACSNDNYSSVCKCALPESLRPGGSLKFSEIFRVPINKSGRIHQIGFYNDALAVAQTCSNSIVFLNPSSGEILSECRPFRDRFGTAIGGDHNHINSISQCGECLLFCAYKAGPTAMIGLLHENRVKGYPIRNKGAHDVYLSGKTLYYSDTFGGTFTDESSECGFLMANKIRVDEEFFNKPPGFAIRGVSQRGPELVVGHSHKGPRAKRFDGNGALFRIVENKVVQTVKTPFAQVYDIVRMDGKHFDAPPDFLRWDEINPFLESILGAPIYEMRLD
ncbi:MAG: hypothetical protein ABIR24_03115 [Verrucomicrobiota bacterium]